MSFYGASNPDITVTTKLQDTSLQKYDAILLMSFGGPEGVQDVIPFLERVTKGRNIPQERLLKVAQNYYIFNGISPINEQNRNLIEAIKEEMLRVGLRLPIYFGNRNWTPFVEDALAQMKEDGIKKALVFVTAGFSCYSGCRQYRENLVSALENIPDGPILDKIRVFYNHPKFIKVVSELIQISISKWGNKDESEIKLVFTAHSIPLSMAEKSDYEKQLHEACRLTVESLGFSEYTLCYQSRSGSPKFPWLEPDIATVLENFAREAVKNVVFVPIGFVSDHIEIIYDLDIEAKNMAENLGLNFLRVASPVAHPEFPKMVVDLIMERMTENPQRLAIGKYQANHDVCPVNCCMKE